MMSYRLLGVGVAAAVGLAVLGASGPQAAAADSGGPPACAKILFRPLVSGLNDGEQEAGIYTSRFSHLELKAAVKGGEPFRRCCLAAVRSARTPRLWRGRLNRSVSGTRWT